MYAKYKDLLRDLEKKRGKLSANAGRLADQQAKIEELAAKLKVHEVQPRQQASQK